MTKKDHRFASILVSSLKQGRQMISPDLAEIARQFKGRIQGGRDDNERNDRNDNNNNDNDNDNEGNTNKKGNESSTHWNQAKKQHEKYQRGAGLGSSAAPKQKKKKTDNDVSDRFANIRGSNFGAALNDFKSSFVPAKKN